MYSQSYEKQVNKTCRKCFTILDFKRDYCCVKGKDECFADIGLVKKAFKQDGNVRSVLFYTGRTDRKGNILSKKFYRGILRNECMIFDYRPPGCRSHFCYRWDDYIRKNPQDFVDANVNVVSRKTLKTELRREYEYGVKLAYPGGIAIYTDRPNEMKKLVRKVLDGLKIKHFETDAGIMDPDDNRKEGVEIIMDRKAVIEKPKLFGTLINNNMFMLVRMKMNMGSTGFNHSNIIITKANPDHVARESPASLKSFHALKVYRISG